MKAELLLRQRYPLGEDAFAEIVVWRVPVPVLGSRHSYKYRLVLIENDDCTLRYDNEAGKGDHRHIGAREEPYTFFSFPRLMADFWADVHARRS